MSKVKIIDFSSDWCPSCKKQKPVFEDLEEEYQNVDFKSVNIDEESGLASEYGIRAVPTLVIEQSGEEVNRFVGFTEADTLREAIDKALGT